MASQAHAPTGSNGTRDLETLLELAASARECANKLGVLTASEWLESLTNGNVAYEDVLANPDLCHIAREISRREQLATLTNAEADRYLTALSILLRAATDHERAAAAADAQAPAPVVDLRCVAKLTNGTRCPHPAKAGTYVCGMRPHMRQIRGILPDRRHETGHVYDLGDRCAVCNRTYDDHEPAGAAAAGGAGRKYHSCVACPNVIDADCVPDSVNASCDELLCPECAPEGRGGVSILLGRATDAEGNPTPGRIHAMAATAPAPPATTVRGSRARDRSDTRTSDGAGGSGAQPGTRRPTFTRAEPSNRNPDERPVGGDPGSGPSRNDDAPADLADQVERLTNNVTALTEMILQMQSEATSQRKEARGAPPSGRHGGDPAGPSGADGRPNGNTGATPAPRHHRDGPQVERAEYEGVKPGTDVAGRPVSSAKHWAHNNYVKNVDLLFTATDAASKNFRNHLGYREPEAGDTPTRHHLEQGWKASVQYHWRLLFLPGPEFDQETRAGQDRITSILTVIVRLRFLHALSTAAARHSNLTWSQTYEFLKSVFDNEMDQQGYSALDQLASALVPMEKSQFNAGVEPHFNDDIQEQVLGSARGRVHLWQMHTSAARPSGGSSSGSGGNGGQAGPCVLCGGAHWARNHPRNAPITIPCSKCGRLHARKQGPNPMTCEQAEAAGLPVQH